MQPRAQPLPAFFRRSLTKYYPLPQHANLQLKQDIKNAATLSAHTHAEHAALTQSLPQIREQAWQRGAATIATWSYIALRGLKLAWVRHLAWLRVKLCSWLTREYHALMHLPPSGQAA